MNAQNALQFYGKSDLSAEPTPKPHPETESPTIAAIEILWAIIAVGTACAAAMFLTS